MTKKSEFQKYSKKSIAELCESLKNKHNNSTKKSYINHIRFPYYKNLEENSEVKFTFPVTILLGANGTNKTSILRALEASPHGKDLGHYWFDTALDAMHDKYLHQYVYGYSIDKLGIVEVKKKRVKSKNRGPDYFETDDVPDTKYTRPSENLKEILPDPKIMGRTRWAPVKMEVCYIDFRQEIPAYDIYMHINNHSLSSSTSRKYVDDLKLRLRRVSPHLERVLSEDLPTHKYHKVEKIVEPPRTISGEELSWISYILNRKYEEIKIVKHNYYNSPPSHVPGYTIKINGAGGKYSEAYAGSGEYSAIMITHRIWNAPHNSLILMDEPETSLHPGAQKNLLKYILYISLKRNIQFIISSHSQYLADGLPNDARKKFDLLDTGKVIVTNSNSLAESFYAMGGFGASYLGKRKIYVEDRLAKFLVEKAISICGSTEERSLYSVDFMPGGASKVWSTIVPTYAHDSSKDLNCYTTHPGIIFDGDQNKPKNSYQHIRKSKDAKREIDQQIIQSYVGQSGFRRYPLKNSGDSEKISEKEIEMMGEAISWMEKHSGYLPGDGNPEKLIIDTLVSENDSNIQEMIVNNDDAKKFWEHKACEDLDEDYVTSNDIFETIRRYVPKISRENEIWRRIYDEVHKVLGMNQ